MQPITHLLIGWEVANGATAIERDRAAIAWAGVAIDLDGLGSLVDLGAMAIGKDTYLYDTYHHFLLHGIFGAALTTAVVAIFSRRRLLTALVAFLTCHIHLLCDFLGSRGPDVIDIWPIYYLGPFSEKLEFSWPSQWGIYSWQNTTISVILIGILLIRAVRKGYSPLSLFSKKADAVFVATLRARWEKMRKRK